jgi:hypothetical protein
MLKQVQHDNKSYNRFIGMIKFISILLFIFTYIFVLNYPAIAAEIKTNIAEPLKVEIVSPKEGEKVHGNITIEARVNHPEAVEYCEFYIQEPGAKDRYSWKDYLPPYFWGGDGQTLDTTMFDDGPASAVAFCFPTDKQSAMFEKRAHFLMDNGKPKVKIISPKDGSIIDRNIMITVDANDTKGIVKNGGIVAVAFYLDGDIMQRLTKQPFQIELSTCHLRPGLHSIRLVAEDTEGLISSENLVINVIR